LENNDNKTKNVKKYQEPAGTVTAICFRKHMQHQKEKKTKVGKFICHCMGW
jgi:hypothetical protein